MSLPNPEKPFAEQAPDTLLAMCLWGEARGVSLAGKAGVASVILNRMAKRGKTIHEVILAPKQFSSFNADDPNSRKLLFPLRYDGARVWDECVTIATLSLAGWLKDLTGGADHYFAATMPSAPYWADPAKGWKQTAVIGGHVYGIAP